MLQTSASLEQWIRGVQSTPFWNACLPHPKFEYPEPNHLGTWNSQAALSASDWKPLRATLARSLNFANAESLRISSRVTDLFENVLSCSSENSPKTVGIPSLCSPIIFEYLRANKHLTLHVLPRDPEDLLKLPYLKDLDLIYFSNPNSVDGFYYPQELYEKLITDLLSLYPRLQLISEESCGVFSFQSLAPGSIRFLKLPPSLEGRISSLFSICPFLAPQGPALNFYSSTSHNYSIEEEWDRLLKAMDLARLQRGLEIVMSYENKQGARMAEFQRRLLALDMHFRNLVDILKPLLQERLIQIPHWNQCGFYLVLDFSHLLKKRGCTLRQLLLETYDASGILLCPGDLFGAPETASLCYAAPRQVLEKAGKMLFEALLKISVKTSPI